MAIAYRLNNSSLLNVAAAWSVNNVLTAPSTANIGTWGSGSSDVISSNATVAIGGNISYAGLTILSTQVTPVVINPTTTAVLSLSSSGIDMSAAGADLTIVPGLTYLANQTWNVKSGRTLNVIGARTGNFLNIITGSGTVALSGSSTSTGGVTLSGSTLILNNAASIGPSLTGRLSIVSGIISSSVATTLGGSLLSISGSFSYTGPVDFSFGAGATTLAATPTITVSDVGRTLTLAGIIGGSGFGITKAGPGILVLGGINTYNGSITINAGTASIAADTGLGAVPASATPNNIILNGGNLRITVASTISANRGMTINSGGGSIENAVAVTYAGIISGSGALTKLGIGTLTLGSANTYSGSTTIAAGTASISADASFGATPVASLYNIIFGGGAGLISTATANLHVNRNINLQTDTVFAPNTLTVLGISGSLSGSGRLILNGAGTLSLAANNPNLSGFTLTLGTLRIGATGSLGTVTPLLTAGSITLDSNAIIYGLSGSGTTAISIGSFNLTSSVPTNITASHGGVISGTGTIVKTGNGLQIFTAANTFTGILRIDSGILRASTSNGSLGTSTAVVHLNGGDLQVVTAAALTFSRDIKLLASSVNISLDKTVSGAGVINTFGTFELPIGGSSIYLSTGSLITSTATFASTQLTKANNTNSSTASFYINDGAKLSFADGNGNLIYTRFNKYNNGELVLQAAANIGYMELNHYGGALNLGGTYSQQYLQKALFSSSAGVVTLAAPAATTNNIAATRGLVEVSSSIIYSGSFTTILENDTRFTLGQNNLYIDVSVGTLQFSGKNSGFVTASNSVTTFTKKGNGTLTFGNTAAYITANPLASITSPLYTRNYSHIPDISKFIIESGTVNIADGWKYDEAGSRTLEMSGGTLIFTTAIDNGNKYAFNYLGNINLKAGTIAATQDFSASVIRLTPGDNDTITVAAGMINSSSANVYVSGSGIINWNGANTRTAASYMYAANLIYHFASGSTSTFNIGSIYSIGAPNYNVGNPNNFPILNFYRGNNVQIGSPVGGELYDPVNIYLNGDFNYIGPLGLITFTNATTKYGATYKYGTFYLDGTSSFNVTVSSLTLNGNIRNTGSSPTSLIKRGDGALYLRAQYNDQDGYQNNYTGPTIISGGTLTIYGDLRYILGDTNPQPAKVGDYTLGLNQDVYISNNATLQLFNNMNFDRNIIIGTGGAQLQVDGAVNYNYANPNLLNSKISGQGNFTKKGLGALDLGGFLSSVVNTYTGSTIIQGGTLSIYNEDHLGKLDNPIIFNGGTLLNNSSFDMPLRNIYVTGALSYINIAVGGTSSIGSLKGSGTSANTTLNKNGVGAIKLNSASIDTNGSLQLLIQAGKVIVNNYNALAGVEICTAVADSYDFSNIQSASVGGLGVDSSARISLPSNFKLVLEKLDSNKTMDQVLSGNNLTIEMRTPYTQSFTNAGNVLSGEIHIYTGSILKQDSAGLDSMKLYLHPQSQFYNLGTTPQNIYTAGNGLSYITNDNITLTTYDTGYTLDFTGGNIEFTGYHLINSDIILPNDRYMRLKNISTFTLAGDFPNLNGLIDFSPVDNGDLWLSPNNPTDTFGTAYLTCTTVGTAGTTPYLWLGGNLATASFYNNIFSSTSNANGDGLSTPELRIATARISGMKLNLYGYTQIDSGSAARLWADDINDDIRVYGQIFNNGIFWLDSSATGPGITLSPNADIYNCDPAYTTVATLNLKATGKINFDSAFEFDNYSTITLQGLNFTLQNYDVYIGNYTDSNAGLLDPIVSTITSEVGFTNIGSSLRTLTIDSGRLLNNVGISLQSTTVSDFTIDNARLDGAGFINNASSTKSLNLLTSFTGSSNRTFNSLTTTSGVINIQRDRYATGNDATGLNTLSRGIINVLDPNTFDKVRISISANAEVNFVYNQSNYIGSLEGAGVVRAYAYQNGNRSWVDIHIGGSNVNSTFSGRFEASGSTDAYFVKEGTGTLTLSRDAYAFEGWTTVNDGILSFAPVTANSDIKFINTIDGTGIISFTSTAQPIFTSSLNGTSAGCSLTTFNFTSTTAATAILFNTNDMGGYANFSGNSKFDTETGANLSFASYNTPILGGAAGQENDTYLDYIGTNGSTLNLGTGDFNWTTTGLTGLDRTTITVRGGKLIIGGSIYSTPTNNDATNGERAWVRWSKMGAGELVLAGTYNNIEDLNAAYQQYIWIRAGKLTISSDAILGSQDPIAAATTVYPRIYIGSSDAYGPQLNANANIQLMDHRVIALGDNSPIISCTDGNEFEIKMLSDYGTGYALGLNTALQIAGSGTIFISKDDNKHTRKTIIRNAKLKVTNIAYAGSSSIGVTTNANIANTIWFNTTRYNNAGQTDNLANLDSHAAFEYVGPIDGRQNNPGGINANFKFETRGTASLISNPSNSSTTSGIAISGTYDVGSNTNTNALYILNGDVASINDFYLPTISTNTFTGSLLKKGLTTWRLPSSNGFYSYGSLTVETGTLAMFNSSKIGINSDSTMYIKGGQFHLSNSTGQHSGGLLYMDGGSIRGSLSTSVLSCRNITSTSGSIYVILANSGSTATNLSHSVGALELYRNNTFTGGFKVDSGIVYIKSDGISTGSFGTGSLVLSGTGQVNLGGYTIDVSSSEFNNTCTASNGTLRYFAGSTATNFTSNGGYITTVLANKSDGSTIGLRHLSGDLILSASNTFSGLADLRSGTVTVRSQLGLGATTGDLTISGATLILNNLTSSKNNVILSGGVISSNGSTSYFTPQTSFTTYTGTLSSNVVWGGAAGLSHRSGTLIISGTHSSSMTAVGALNKIENGTVKCANNYALGGATNGYRLLDTIYVTGTLQAVGDTRLQISGNLRFASGGKFKFGGS